MQALLKVILQTSQSQCTAIHLNYNANIWTRIEKEESIAGSTVAVAGSIVAPSIKDDDLEEEGFSPSQSLAAQNSLEEIEGKLARTHPLYQAQPKEDDLYHCPNEGQTGCTHKPTKLKCNYE